MLAFTLLAALALTSAADALPADPTQTEFIRLMESRRGTPPRHLDADSSHSYDMLTLSLDYRVEPDGLPLTGFADIRLRARESLTVIPFNAQGMTILGVNVHDQALPFTHVQDTLRVSYPMQIGDTATLSIQLSAPSQTVPGGTGFHSDAFHVYTFSEPYGARKWLPCFDQPFDKFEEVRVAVNMPANWWLASNGTLIETTYPSAGRKREVYYHDHPISPYLVMLAASGYARRFETVGGVHYRYFAFPQDSAAADYDWRRTPLMLAVYESLFGDYPFAEYGMVQTGIMGGWGAMEHQTFKHKHTYDGSQCV